MNERDRIIATIAALGVLVIAGGSRSSAAGAPAPAVGGRVARMRTAPSTRSAWIGTRLAAARTALAGRVPEAARESIARDFVAHWMREVGPQDTTPTHATSEFNFNVANITAPSSYRGPYYLSSSGHKFKSFATLPEAVNAYLSLISTADRYAASWAQLLSAPDDVAEWNAQLVGAGFEDPSTANIAEVRRELPVNRSAVDAWVASHG